MNNIFHDKNNNEKQKPDDRDVNWRISAYAAVVKDGKLLLMVPTWDKNRYDLPGGGVEIDERIEDAVIRETLEETGYKVKIINSNPIYLTEDRLYAVNIDKYFHSVVIIYKAQLEEEKQYLEYINMDGKVRETESVEWIRLQDLNKENFFNLFYPVLRCLKNS